MRAIEAISGQPWAIERSALRQIAAISLRQHDIEAGMRQVQETISRRNDTPSAIAARAGLPVRNTSRATQRNGVAILPLTGPVFPRANMMTEFSGATSLSLFSRDFHQLLDDPDIKAIIIDIDSPGGVAFGPGELASLIRGRSSNKPVVAYVSGWACSAAYWIAAAADRIVANESSELGSIGVVCTVSVQEEPDMHGERYIDVVSSNAQKKRVDVRTDEGKAEIVRELDDLEEIFIGAVANYRNKTREDVLADFGGGGIMIASKAVAAGMADETGEFESLLQELSTGSFAGAKPRKSTTQPEKQKKETAMNVTELKAKHPEIAEALIKEGREAGHADGVKVGKEEGQKDGKLAGISEGAQAERDRLAGIDKVAKPGHEKLVAEAKADGKSTAADVALAINQVEQSQGTAQVNRLVAANAALPTIDPAGGQPPAPAAKVEDAGEDLPPEDQAKKDWEARKEIREEFGDLKTYTAYVKSQASGRGRIIKPAAR